MLERPAFTCSPTGWSCMSVLWPLQSPQASSRACLSPHSPRGKCITTTTVMHIKVPWLRVLTSTCWVGAGMLLPVFLSTREGKRKKNQGFMALHHNLYRIRRPISCSVPSFPSAHQLPDGTSMATAATARGCSFPLPQETQVKPAAEHQQEEEMPLTSARVVHSTQNSGLGLLACCCSPYEGGCLL